MSPTGPTGPAGPTGPTGPASLWIGRCTSDATQAARLQTHFRKGENAFCQASVKFEVGVLKQTGQRRNSHSSA